MKASKILNEVIFDLIKNVSNRGLENQDYNKINFRGIKYKLFRILTTQKIRDFIWNVSKVIFDYYKKIKNENFFLRYDFLLRHYLDYLDYVTINDPEIPLSLYPKKDHRDLINFLRNVFISCFLKEIDNGLIFGEKDWNEYITTKKIVKRKLRFHGKFFNYDNFISIKPTEFPLIEKKWYLSIFNKKAKKIIFDLGAYFGESVFVLNQFFKPKIIFAFEPDPDNYKILKENIKLNKLKKITREIKYGVGKKEGFFFLKKSFSASTIYSSKKQNSIKVKVTTIDNFVKKNKIEKVDFIKMDIEGAEFDALKGAVKTLKRDKPDLMVAVYHKGEHFFEIPGWLKKQVPEYNLRFVAMNGASPIIERYVAASTERI